MSFVFYRIYFKGYCFDPIKRARKISFRAMTYYNEHIGGTYSENPPNLLIEWMDS